MKVIEHIERATGPMVSVEIIPPRRGGSAQKIHQAIESLQPFNPPFIDVTSHSAEIIWEEMSDGSFKKRIKRKSPGTFGLCAAIKYKYNIDPVPHILCAGFTREETEDALIELNYLGIENILAIKGDAKYRKPIAADRSVNNYASDLVSQVNRMNQGKYLDELIDVTPTEFCIGVAAYPEKHFESPNKKFDVSILKKKQDLGAHYAVTQMFFNNEHYYEYVRQAREAGITIPIIPGLKILTSKSQLSSIPRAFHVDIPEEITEKMLAAKTREEEVKVGIEWALKQSVDLLEKGINNLHYYVMQNTSPFTTLMEHLKARAL
ncbi:MAG: methylenetetrahydrofolate reductase [Bacteroidia bacterium]|nr:methylenetetrahydrofolate reductase [Bacteroidia bacterium]